MEKLICPVKTKFFENVEENLKVIILLACNNVNQLIECPVVVAADCSSNILSNIFRSSVLAEKNFFVIVFVLALAYYVCYVNTYRAVRGFEEYAFIQAFKVLLSSIL